MSTEPSLSTQKALVAQWSDTGRTLQTLHWAELAAQSPEESQRAAFDMLQLGGMLPADPTRERSSGLIEMRRLLARWHERGSA